MKSLPMHLLFWMGLMGLTAGLSNAQVSVDIPGYGVKVQTGNKTTVNVNSGSGNTASGQNVSVQTDGKNTAVVNSGSVASDVEMEGITVINGEVWIDGKKIPKGKTSYTSRKTGKSYRIQWGKDENVSVTEK